ncbi:MAG TPA: DUF4416 family protein [bacterium]|nr:DUF4416 family protein [bacterium]
MKALTHPPDCIFFAAILSNNAAAHDDVCQSLVSMYGEPVLKIDPIAFDHSDYYRDEMGDGLLKGFLAFPPPFHPGQLALRKREMREIEWCYGISEPDGFHRIVNIDPGYVNLSQVVLATSKNFSHRIYLNDGVFAEVTLLYHASGWETLPWTYPDYRIPEIQEFLTQCRFLLKRYIDRRSA